MNRLAAELRRINELLMTQQPSEDDDAALTAMASAISTRLAASPRRPALDARGVPVRVIEHGPVRGVGNAVAPPLRPVTTGTEAGGTEAGGTEAGGTEASESVASGTHAGETDPAAVTVLAEVVMGLAYEGPPGCVHGGWVAALFDDVLGGVQARAAALDSGASPAGPGGRRGMTGRLTVRYRRPTPLGQPLSLRGWVVRSGRRVRVTRATLHADGQLCAEAEGLFVEAPSTYASELAARRARLFRSVAPIDAPG